MLGGAANRPRYPCVELRLHGSGVLFAFKHGADFSVTPFDEHLPAAFHRFYREGLP